MDQAAIARASDNLRTLLDRYATENVEAAELRRALLPLLDRARRAEITTPISYADIPGGYFFTEGTLRKYRDLEEALANFKLQISGISERAAEIMKGIPKART